MKSPCAVPQREIQIFSENIQYLSTRLYGWEGDLGFDSQYGQDIYYVYLLYYVCIAVFTLDAGLLARSQYSEGPATGHRDTGFSWFLCAYKQMLRWFPTFQVTTTCFSCIPPDLNLLVTNFIFCIHVK